jgi:predicted RND superfamily exporter protein
MIEKKGIGIDDMFIIYASFTKQQDKCAETSKIIANTFRKAGVSITITSVTDFLAFIVGVVSDFKGVQIFSLYAGKQTNDNKKQILFGFVEFIC